MPKYILKKKMGATIMTKKSSFMIFLTTALFVFMFCFETKAEINFDFGLPLFRQREINFEKTKPADYNIQLLKKYIIESKDKVINQYHAILRLFTLMKLSDTPKYSELLSESNKYFSLEGKENPTDEEILRNIFYNGVLLSSDKEEDPQGKKDQAFEELLLNNEERLQKNANYWIAKGILFQVLKNRSNNYFSLMKPEEDLKIALTLIPKTPQYYYIMGQCFRFLGNSDSALFLAIASYEKSASLNISNSKLQNSVLSIYMGLHEEYQAKGKKEPFWLEEAVYKKIIDIAPTNAYALNNLGYLYAEYGVNTQKAMELCQKAVGYNPENAGFQDSLGWAAFKNKRFKLAEEALLKSISLKKNIYDSRYHLATLYYTTNNYKKAAAQYEEAIKLNPDSAEALNNLAYLYTELNTNIDKALTMALKANKIEPNNASYLDTLGWAYYRLNDLDKALIYLKKADSLIPAQSEILLHIGRVYFEKREFDNALIYSKEAYKVNPDLKDPDDTLYITIRLKAYNEALASYHGTLGQKAEKSKVLSILMDISRIYQEKGLFDKSIEITKICSDLSSGKLTLEKPLLDTYKLQNKNKTEDKKEITDKTIETTLPTENTADKKETEKEEEKKEDNESTLLPTDIDCPLAVNFCTDFFKILKKFLPNISDLTKCNVTIIVDRLLFPHKTAIIRISSDSISGKDLKDKIISTYSIFSANKKELPKTSDENHDYLFFIGKCYFVVTDNAIYFSSKPITNETIASYSNLLPYKDEVFMEIYYDNKAFHNRFPSFISSFITNPFKPFEYLLANYKLSDKGITEFIIVSTGKTENDDFVKKIAGKLFKFKVDANKLGITTTIKMKSEKDLLFISTEFENLFDWYKQKLNIISGNLSNFLPVFFKIFKRKK